MDIGGSWWLTSGPVKLTWERGEGKENNMHMTEEKYHLNATYALTHKP